MNLYLTLVAVVAIILQFEAGSFAHVPPVRAIPPLQLVNETINVVCSKGEQLCYNNCFNPTTHYCNDSPIVPIVCPIGHTQCGIGCYNPAIQVCHDWKVACDPGQAACYYECYSPAIQQCLNNRVVCNLGEDLCEFKCYNKIENVCHNDRQLCKVGELPCGNYNCYDPESQLCDKGLVCNKDQIACRGQCYPQKDAEWCFNQSIQCPPDLDSCGYQCYNSAHESCHTLSSSGDFINKIVCPKEHLPCGFNTCYDPVKEVCLKEGKVCPLGFHLCGKKCFNPNGNGSQSICLDNQIVCKQGEERCGYECYKPSSPGAICYKDDEERGNLLCKGNEQLRCGCNCYDEKKQICYTFYKLTPTQFYSPNCTKGNEM